MSAMNCDAKKWMRCYDCTLSAWGYIRLLEVACTMPGNNDDDST